MSSPAANALMGPVLALVALTFAVLLLVPRALTVLGDARRARSTASAANGPSRLVRSA